MLLFRAKIPQDWLPKILGNLPEVLIDHAHLERKAATTSISLEKYRELFHRVDELNAIAIEELQHFQLVLALLKRRGIAFTSLALWTDFLQDRAVLDLAPRKLDVTSRKTSYVF